MDLGELIEVLEGADPATYVPIGFASPHSYRGIYADVAFKPEPDTTVGDMLKSAREALDSTYQGWKGGDFKMEHWVDCYLAEEGCTGEQIGPYLLKYMIGEIKHD